MLASLEDAPLADPNFVYEPKYDGIRAIVEVAAGGEPVRLWSRLGNDKTAQFPEIARALADWGRSRREPVVLDGEIVALNADGEPAGFQNLQGRIHLKELVAGRRSPSTPVQPFQPFPPFQPFQPFPPFRRLHRFRRASRRTDGLTQSAVDRTSRGSRTAPSQNRIANPAHQRAGRRGRAGPARACAREWLGRAHREACGITVRVGKAHIRLAQTEDSPGAGVRDRRMDRAAPEPHVLWRARARSIRSRCVDLRGACRHGIQRARTTTPDASDETDRNRDVAICESRCRPTSGRIGSSRRSSLR